MAATPQFHLKEKPKIPQKPAHLCKNSFHNKSECCQNVMHEKKRRGEKQKPAVKRIESEQMIRCLVDKEIHETPSTSSLNDQRRKSSHAAMLSKQFADVEATLGLRSTSSESVKKESDEVHTAIYEDDLYVEINAPKVEPGTIIRCVGCSDEFETVRSNVSSPIQNLPEDSDSSSLCCTREGSVKYNRIKKLSDSFQHQAIVKELQRNFRSSSLDSLCFSRKKNGPEIDEDGYEVPIALRMPIYMSFDSEVASSSADETDPHENVSASAEEKSKPKKKRRLARYKRKYLTNELSTSSLVENLSRNFALRFPTNKMKDEKRSGQLGSSKRDAGDAKSICTFLSAKLSGSKAENQTETNTYATLTENLSVDFSTQFYPSSDSADEWSEDSECCSDAECYYQQIDPPDLSGYRSEHDYEVISECLMGSAKDLRRKKSVKSVVASYVGNRKREKRTKSNESNKSVSEVNAVKRKLQRRNMQDMRSTNIADCSWDTVSTPGILKLNEFKDFGRSRLNRGEVVR